MTSGLAAAPATGGVLALLVVAAALVAFSGAGAGAAVGARRARRRLPWRRTVPAQASRARNLRSVRNEAPASTGPEAAAVATRVRVAAAAGSALAALAVVPGPAAWGVACVAAVVVWRWSRTWEPASLRRQRALIEADLPALVILTAALVASGADPARALRSSANALGGPIKSVLAPVLLRLDLGEAPVSVWSELSRIETLEVLGRTLHRCARSGAPVQVSLRRLSEDLISERRNHAEVRVRQVAVRATIPVAALFLPAFVLLAVVPMVAGAVGSVLAG